MSVQNNPPSVDVPPDYNSQEVAVCGSKEVGALAHLYRAEVFRSTAWRQRLDMTTNWAVVCTGISFTVSYQNKEASALPIALVMLLTVMFLSLEARRYRYFQVWKFRARLLEIAFYVPLLQGEGAQIPLDRGTALSEDYMHPKHRITTLRSVGRRIRRNYAWIFMIQGAALYGKIIMQPTEVQSWAEFIHRFHLGPVSGEVNFALVGLFHLTWIFIAVFTKYQENTDTSRMSDYLNADE